MNILKKSISLLLLIGFTNSNAQSIISWSSQQKLNWSDFKGIANTDIYAYAQTSYKIEIQPSNVSVDENNNVVGYKSLTAIANFYTKHSWVYEKDDYLLLHEQLHFDIAELYARKMRMEFHKLKVKKIANFDSYAAVYNRLWNQCRSTQKKYDKETNHGQSRAKNDEWIQKIASQLDTYNSYEVKK